MTDPQTMATPEMTQTPVPNRCGRCGYDATGLTGTVCPECAFDLTRIPYLRYADRGWLRLIVVGTHFIRVGAIGLIVTLLGGARWAATTLRGLGFEGLADRMVSRFFLVSFLFAAIAGAWLLSTPDPTYQLDDDRRRARRNLERIGIGTAASLGAVRIFGDGVLHPIVNALITCAAMTCGLLMVIRMASLVKELLARSEAAAAKDGDAPSDSRGWINWAIAGVFFIGLMSLRSGATSAAMTMERLALSIGAIMAAFSLLNLIKGTRAIREELEKAAGDTAARSSPQSGS